MESLKEVENKPILYAAYDGSQKFSYGDTNDCRDHRGRTVLMHAAIGDSAKLVSSILKKDKESLDKVDDRGATVLHWAARCGSIEVAKEILKSITLIEAKKLIISKDCDDVTPFHVAASNTSAKMLKLFEKYIHAESIQKIEMQKESQKLEIEILDKNRRSPLHYAASRASLECVRQLLDSELLYFRVDQKDSFGMTPLMCTVGVNLPQAVEVCELLLNRKRIASMSANVDKQTALHLAVASGNVRIVKLLLSFEVQIDTLDGDNRTPLHYAAEQGEVDIVKILLDAKASVVSRDKTGAVPAHYAAQSSKNALSLILEKSRGREVKDAEGRTCLMWAACAGNEEVVSFLLQKEVDRKEADNKGYTALHLAAMANQENMCKFLVRQGWNTSERDQQNNTPMHLAAGRGHVEVVRSLVTMQANLNDKDAMGRTPTFWPFLGGQPHTAHVMIRELGFEWRTSEGLKRSRPLVDNCGRTPLHAAAFAGYPACISILLKIESADSDSLISQLIGWRDQDGQTALHVACQRGTVDCVQLLLRSGAGLNALDNDHQTPLDFAYRCENNETRNATVKYLKNNHALTGEEVINLAASTIQKCYRIYRFRNVVKAAYEQYKKGKTYS